MSNVLAVQVNTPTTIPPLVNANGTCQYGEFGWGQFFYDVYGGRLQPVRFSSAILYPEQPNATDFQLYQPVGMHGTYQKLVRDNAVFNIAANGTVQNMAKGLFSLVLSNVFSSTSYVGGAIQRNFHVPDLFRTKQASSSAQNNGSQSSSFGPLIYGQGIYLVLLQMASEIAQMTVAQNAAETNETFNLAVGANFVAMKTGTARFAQVLLNNPPAYPDVRWGSTGANFFGWLSFEHNGYYEAPQYINSPQVQFTAYAPGATGVLAFLKPGCAATMNVYENSYQLQSLQTDLGDINMLAGIIPSALATATPKP